jgi:hypothetical protein
LATPFNAVNNLAGVFKTPRIFSCGFEMRGQSASYRSDRIEIKK